MLRCQSVKIIAFKINVKEIYNCELEKCYENEHNPKDIVCK